MNLNRVFFIHAKFAISRLTKEKSELNMIMQIDSWLRRNALTELKASWILLDNGEFSDWRLYPLQYKRIWRQSSKDKFEMKHKHNYYDTVHFTDKYIICSTQLFISILLIFVVLSKKNTHWSLTRLYILSFFHIIPKIIVTLYLFTYYISHGYFVFIQTLSI